MPRTSLVVDDSSAVRKIARRILEAHGFEVDQGGDGQQALRMPPKCRLRCSTGTCR
jgi:two-component system chemotaxis response regulator CheY